MQEIPCANIAVSASYAVPPIEFAKYSLTASYCITGSYIAYNTASPAPPVAKTDEVQEFFEKLGYVVGFDSSRRTGEAWYEINDEDSLVVQIDQGVPLADIIMDLCEMHQGKPGISKSDYKICGPQCEELDLLFKRVYDWTKMGIEPNGQLTFAL